MKSLGLRTKLLAGALLLAAVPLLIATFVIPPHIERLLTAHGRAALVQTARDLAVLTEQVIAQHREVVRGIASIEGVADRVRARNAGQLDPGGLAQLNRQLGALLASLSPHYQGLWAAHRSGVIFAGTLKNGDTTAYANLDVHDRAYFVQARDTLQPVISEPMISKVGNVPIVVITVPLKTPTGEFDGLIGLSVEVDYLAQIISTQKLGETGYPFAIDRRGLMFAHPDPARTMKLNFTEVAGAELVARRMLAGETGIEEYVSSQGDRKVAAFSPVAITGWSIAASQNADEFTASIRRLRWFLHLLLAACLGLAALAGIVFALRVTRPVRQAASTLGQATRLMDSGAAEIADGAQTLAAAASQQAASIEQTSASLTELTATTRSNSERAREAAQLVQTAGQRMQSAGTRMSDLERAVRSAAEAGEQTRKVIKTIDEIAFQTNILALNAAVEAARAGEAGAGFAVVADEVRSLAGRAAHAARESAETLERVGDLVNRSRELAASTSQEFGHAQADADRTAALMSELADASHQQSSALEQVSNSLLEFESGTQAGAAHAEESAAAAQQLRAQAVTIRREIGVLEHLVEGTSATAASQDEIARPDPAADAPPPLANRPALRRPPPALRQPAFRA